jgi:murein DD-endopeptidase MepM/ murein hydrolase activator NlpD
MRAFRRWARLFLFVLIPVVCAAAVASAVRADRRAGELQSTMASMQDDLGRLQEGDERSAWRLTVLGRRLEAVSHPLHAALVWPVDGAVTSPFGLRGCCSWHPGLDIDVPEGGDVRAAAAGTVVAEGWEEGYGNRVIVDHGRGLETVYAHLDSIAVQQYEAVTSATVLGGAGCSGICDGVHLHFEVRLYGVKSDPELWLPPQAPGAAGLHWSS